jgi:hypothetical protein
VANAALYAVVAGALALAVQHYRPSSA